jgi:ABC-type multidrug transport system fused ATPase/permease subunit
MEAKKTILWLYYFSLGLMLVSLSFSGYYMSVAQFGLVGALLLDGMKKEAYDDFIKRHNSGTRIILFLPVSLWWILNSLIKKTREFFHRENAPAWIFASIYLFHLIGLFYTSDLNYALKDLRIKLPILILPFLLSTTNLLDRKSFRFFIYLFCAAVFTGTLISTYHLVFSEFTDSREISRYISHIRFSLLIDMAIFILAYQVFKKNDLGRWPKAALSLVALWMLLFLFLSAFMTGLVIFFITSALLIFYMVLNRQGMILKLATLAGVIALFIILAIYIRNIGKDVNHIEPVDFNTLERTTKLGNPYWHDLSNPQAENGSFVWLYVATDELREAWNKRSSYAFDGKDKAGQEIKYTIIRFLTSKGYRKDAEGVSKLTDQEVAMVEDGTASIIYVEKPNLYVRIYKIFWEYNRYQVTQNASGHSVMQRLVFWQTSGKIIKENWVTGVGTGDLDKAFQEEYTKSGTLLDKEFRWRSHNQFLAIFATFGVFGLAWFLFSLIFPAARLSKFHDYYYLSFFIIVMLSMLTEDTLETQAGVTVFAFFNSFYLFAKKFIDIV